MYYLTYYLSFGENIQHPPLSIIYILWITVVSLLYHRSLELVLLFNNVDLLINFPLAFFPLTISASGNHHSTLSFYDINFLKFNTCVGICSICLSLPGLFHLIVASGFIYTATNHRVLPFSKINSIIVYMYDFLYLFICFCFINLLMDPRLIQHWHF